MKKYILMLIYLVFVSCSSPSSSDDTREYVQVTNNGTQDHTISITSDTVDTITITVAQGATSDKIELEYSTTYSTSLGGTSTGKTTNSADANQILLNLGATSDIFLWSLTIGSDDKYDFNI